MLDFRKVLLALSVAGLGLVSTASAQLPQCTGFGFGVGAFEGYVAAEGATESLPPLQVTCNGQAITGALTLTLTSSVPFTNQLVGTSTSKIDVVVADNGGDTNTAVPATATATQVGPTTVQITFPTVTGVLSTINISGLRVNAGFAPVGSQITVTLGSTSIALNSTAATALPVAFVAKTLSSVTITSALNTSACTAGLNTTLNTAATAVLTNGFPDSLKKASEITNGSVVAATQGTRFAVTFNNLNAGVNYYVQPTITSGSLTLTAYTAATGTTQPTTVASGAAAGLVLLTQSGGSATVYYGVTADSLTGTETANIVLQELVPSIAAVTAYSTQPVSVSVVLVGPSTGYPQYSTSQTPYTATQTASSTTNGLLTPCTTTLLFPYVVNAAGYDTGIAITNASTGTGLTPAAGSCAVTFYGGAGTPPVYNTGVIATTGEAAFTVSAQAPGAQGYAVAVCNFQGAHGYAFVTDGFGGAGKGLSADYLAVVIGAQGLVAPAVAF